MHRLTGIIFFFARDFDVSKENNEDTKENKIGKYLLNGQEIRENC